MAPNTMSTVFPSFDKGAIIRSMRLNSLVIHGALIWSWRGRRVSTTLRQSLKTSFQFGDTVRLLNTKPVYSLPAHFVSCVPRSLNVNVRGSRVTSIRNS